MHAYNSAQAAAQMVLLAVGQGDSHVAIRELWFVPGSDAARRKFARVYCEHNRHLSVTLKKSILWALDALDRLAIHRNNAAHSDMLWHYDRLVPGLNPRPAQLKKLLEEPFDDIWRKLKGDLSAVSNYLMSLHLDVVNKNVWPSSKRPRLALLRPKGKFKELAREVEADENEARWDERLRKVAKPKPEEPE